MRRPSQLLGWTIYVLCCTLFPARGQPALGITKAKEYIDQEVQRHKWELNLNVGGLLGIDQSTSHQYYYMFKRNTDVKKAGKGRAWRFSLTPNFGNGKQYHPTDTTSFGTLHVTDYLIAPQVMLGHEWQRIHGRTMLFGGVDLAGKLSWHRYTAYNATSPWNDNTVGTIVSTYHRNMAWVSTFLGAKLYLNHRISLSIETQLRYGVSLDNMRIRFDNEPISKHLNTYRDIQSAPSYLINLSYNLK